MRHFEKHAHNLMCSVDQMIFRQNVTFADPKCTNDLGKHEDILNPNQILKHECIYGSRNIRMNAFVNS